jgi:hypothetical protein
MHTLEELHKFFEITKPIGSRERVQILYALAIETNAAAPYRDVLHSDDGRFREFRSVLRSQARIHEQSLAFRERVLSLASYGARLRSIQNRIDISCEKAYDWHGSNRN